MANAYCSKCQRTMSDDNFYTYKDGTKVELCKKCLTMHIDNWNPETYLWILEKLDYPYVEEEWAATRDNFQRKHPGKMTSLTVLGKYISKMKLKQYKQYGYADTEYLREKRRLDNLANMTVNNQNAATVSFEEIQKKYEAGEISEAEFKTYSTPSPDNPLFAAPIMSTMPESPTPQPYPGPTPMPMSLMPMSPNANNLALSLDMSLELTEEDVKYLAIKWGKFYQAEEWIKLEESYKKMTDSFDIRDADSISALKMLCKTELKMNQAIDTGDIESFQKLSRVYDSLRKSAKFTAAQNKEQSSDFVDSIGELVAMCEKEGGFIPRFPTDIPQDKVDVVLADSKKYTYNLVTQEMGLGKQIEDAIKALQAQLEKAEDELSDGEDDIRELTDEDYEDHYQHIEKLQLEDEEIIQGV